jgi:hypothetical protein
VFSALTVLAGHWNVTSHKVLVPLSVHVILSFVPGLEWPGRQGTGKQNSYLQSGLQKMQILEGNIYLGSDPFQGVAPQKSYASAAEAGALLIIGHCEKNATAPLLLEPPGSVQGITPEGNPRL